MIMNFYAIEYKVNLQTFNNGRNFTYGGPKTPFTTMVQKGSMENGLLDGLFSYYGYFWLSLLESS